MSTPVINKPLTGAEEITPEWIAERREILARGQFTARASATRYMIEIVAPSGVALPLMLPSGGTVFVSRHDRDTVLERLNRLR